MRLHFSLVVLLCVVIEIHSERTRSGVCHGCRSGYTRIKRAKYYSSPPQRFYKRPPITYPIRGAFSYTPPPNYMMDDDDQPQPPPSFRSKVSNKPKTEGLGDEDIDNLVKYLSSKDLDRVIEFANEKKRESSHRATPFETDYPNKQNENRYEGRIVNKDVTNFNDQKFSLNGPYVSANQDFRPYNLDSSNTNDDIQNSKLSSYPEQGPAALFINQNKLQSNSLYETEESMQSQRFTFSDAIYPPLSDINFNLSGANSFTDSRIMQEEQLPKPLNLREDDYDVSFTNNVPTVLKSDSESYKVENFGALPLMNYHSKLDTVDSYKVPHYTVTSPGKHMAPTSNFKVPVEPAPPVSVAQEQSDAHLKAIKIWTHKSKGTAYTLHDDGSLSLERPSRSKNSFGHS